jgi:hypothetical protein
VLAISLGLNGWLYYKHDKLSTVVTLIDQKDKLQQQQMNELTLIMYNKTNDNIAEVARQQGKIEGMLAVIHNIKPDSNEHSAVWHAGYHRGLDQAKDMKSLEDDTVLTTDKTPKKK